MTEQLTLKKLSTLSVSKYDLFGGSDMPLHYDHALPQQWLNDFSNWLKNEGSDITYDLIRSTTVWDCKENKPISMCYEVSNAWQDYKGSKLPPPSDTPWGQTQCKTKLCDGVWFVSTSSHGGMWLSVPRINQLKRKMELEPTAPCPNFLGMWTWWEEDDDAPFVAAAFGHLFEDDQLELAVRALNRVDKRGGLTGYYK